MTTPMSTLEGTLFASTAPAALTVGVQVQRREILASMRDLIPWASALDVVGSLSSKKSADTMSLLRVLFVQEWFGFHDDDIALAIEDSSDLRAFIGEGRESAIPDFDCFRNFKYSLESNGRLDAIRRLQNEVLVEERRVLFRGEHAEPFLAPMATASLNYWAGSNSRHFREHLGLATYLLLSSRDNLHCDMAWIEHWIVPALKHQQIGFFFDEYNIPVGFLAWAFLAPDVEKRFAQSPAFVLHEYEWHEGEHLWFVTMVSPLGRTRDIIRHAQQALFPEHDVAFSLRRRDDGYVKIRAWMH